MAKSYIVGNQLVVKNINQTAILNIIRERKSISRVALAQMTNLSQSTISSIIGELIEDGYVQEISPENSTGGRRATLLRLSMSNKIIGAICIHRKITTLAILDFDANVLCKESVWTDSQNPDEFLRSCAYQLRQISHQFPESSLISVGVTIPGPVDPQSGTILRLTSLNWKKVPAREIIQNILDTKVILENEANAVSLAESFYGTNGSEEVCFAYVMFGDEVGTGVIFNDQLLRSQESSGFEFGHTLVHRDGEFCSCGSSGCWEAYVSNSALVREYSRLIEKKGVLSKSLHHEKIKNLTAGQVNAMVQLQWECDAPDIWHFNVYRSTKPEFDINVDCLVGSTATNSFLCSTVKPDSTYYYSITVVDHKNHEGEPSEIIPFTVKKVESTFFDDFSVDSIQQYKTEGDVHVTWDDGNLSLGDKINDQNDMIFFQGEHGDCEILATIKPTAAGIWDSMGIIAKVKDKENWYCGLLAYGIQLKEQHSLAFMRRVSSDGKRHEEWLAFYPFSVEIGKEYFLKMRVYKDTIKIKAWQKGKPEPDNWQLSIIDEIGLKPGGVGIRHFGLGAEVHFLSIIDLVSPMPKDEVFIDEKTSEVEKQVKLIVTKAKDGNEIAIDALKEIARWMGIGLVNIINTAGVKTIFITGYLTEAWDLLLPEIQKEINKKLFVLDPSEISLIPKQLNESTIILGAASLAAKEVFSGYRCVY